MRGQKLVLKDGTFQLVREYKVEGDRVRFYSVERGDWEEIPANLVDWDATKKATRLPDKGAEQAVRAAHDLDIEQHPGALDVGAGLGLPAGVLLPPGQGMFAFDGRGILQLKPNLAESKLNKGRFIASVFIPAPVFPKRYTVYLEGKQAAARINNSEPVFFYRTSSGAPPELRLLRVRTKGKRREIEFLSNFLGEKSTQANEIPLNMQQVERDTYRVMATQDLSPGEYALAQIDPDQRLDLYFWDFGIDPSPTQARARK